MGADSEAVPIVRMKNNEGWDFPGGPVVKNPPSNVGDAGSIPGRGTKIPHASGQLSPHATTTEPVRSGARKPQLEKSLRTTVKDPVCHN